MFRCLGVEYKMKTTRIKMILIFEDKATENNKKNNN